MSLALRDIEWPPEFPLDASDLARYDESADTEFYSEPRFVTHIDDASIAQLTRYYGEVFPAGGGPNIALLDLCSSWISHYPPGYTAGRIAGLGLNSAELSRNPILSDYVVQDLNTDCKLPYADGTFDVVTNTVSIDYLTNARGVYAEVCRVLKPGGLAICAFSNRCFPTKAIAAWTSTGDVEHAIIIGAYLHYAGGFAPPEARDLFRSAPGGGPGAGSGAGAGNSAGGGFGGPFRAAQRPRGDPMYVVTARKL